MHLGRSQPWINAPQQDAWLGTSAKLGAGIRKWRLTVLFVLTAVLCIALAIIIANRVIGSHTETDLIRNAQVDDTRAMVLWTTLAPMGGLFFVLLGFIVAADVTINRPRPKELPWVEEANRILEVQAQARTQQLEEANRNLVEAQEQLARAEKLSAIGQLAGGAAHDLRNSLGAMRNAVNSLKRRPGANQAAEANPGTGQFLQVIEDEVHHSNRIIADLMGIARVDPLSRTTSDLGEVVARVISSVPVRPNVRVDTRLDPALPAVLADEHQLRRVFANLVNNAQDAMPGGGTLTITTRKLGESAEVEFRDNGVGIEAENIKRVFDPLFTTKRNGTGLGLSICQNIVAEHRGTLSVSSRQGEGATFTIRLPLNGAGPQGQKEGPEGPA